MFASIGAAGTVMGLSSHLLSAVCLLALGGALWAYRRSRLRADLLHRQELALRKELLAYLLFNGSPRTMPPAEMGRQISRLIAVRSSFGRAALLLRDAGGSLAIAGSAGFDDLSVEALNRWGRSLSGKELSLSEIAAGGQRVANSSFTLKLDRRSEARNPLTSMSCKEVHIVPLQTARGLIGALVVCSEPRSVRGTPETHAAPFAAPFAARLAGRLPLSDLLQPLEALALRLTMQLAAPENVTPLWPERTGPRQEHHPRSLKARDRAARSAETPSRRSLDETATAAGTGSTAAAFDRIRGVLNTAGGPLQSIAGVSGRPPARVWR